MKEMTSPSSIRDADARFVPWDTGRLLAAGRRRDGVTPGHQILPLKRFALAAESSIGCHRDAYIGSGGIYIQRYRARAVSDGQRPGPRGSAVPRQGCYGDRDFVVSSRDMKDRPGHVIERER